MDCEGGLALPAPAPLAAVAPSGAGASGGARRRPVKVVHLYCGIDAVRPALDQVYGSGNYEVVLSVDKRNFGNVSNQPLFDTHKENYGEEPMDDLCSPPVLEAAKKHAGQVALAVAGFCCQPFAHGGGKLGLGDRRHDEPFAACLAILAAVRPDVILLENSAELNTKEDSLVGSLRTYFGKLLREMGYIVSDAILNSVFFEGCGTSRRRMFFVATRDLVPRQTCQFTFYTLTSLRECQTMESCLLPLDHADMPAKTIQPIVYDSTDKLGGAGYGEGCRRIGRLQLGKGTVGKPKVVSQMYRVYSSDGAYPAICTASLCRHYDPPDGVRLKKEGKYVGEIRVVEAEPSYVVLDKRFTPPRARVLAMRELYNLMGFPATFTFNKDPKEALKHIGNSIAVPVLVGILRELAEQGFLPAALPAVVSGGAGGAIAAARPSLGAAAPHVLLPP